MVSWFSFGCSLLQAFLSFLVQKSNDAYQQANKFAETKLPSTHPIRLGLALNYSVFFYEIKNEPEKACELAKKVTNHKYCNDELTWCCW